MPIFPYEKGPDSFWLLLPSGSNAVSVRPYVSPFGETDELLCNFEGILIGKLVNRECDTQAEIIQLLPTLDQTRSYDWPSGAAFAQALDSLLRKVPGAVLTCERDAEQEEIARLADAGELADALELVFAYCEGRSSSCPTFSYVSRPIFPGVSV